MHIRFRAESLIVQLESPLEPSGSWAITYNGSLGFMKTKAATRKNYLRTRLKSERLNLTRPFMERSAIALSGHLLQAELLKDCKNIAIYLPFKGEISSYPIIEYALSQGINCYIPRVFPNNKRGMWFLPYTGKDSVQSGKFGILEPTASISEAIRPSELDLIFTPLVAFDLNGNRLGMGGGYYDAVMSAIPKRNRPPLIALAYNFQQVSDIPCENWDITIDGVVTPSYYRTFSEIEETA